MSLHSDSWSCDRPLRLKHLATTLALGVLMVNPSSWAQDRPSVVLEGTARLVVDLRGGSIGEFRLKNNPLNPLHWGTPPAGNMDVRGFGHFLCLDRWGPPSEAEGKQGMPYHGEAAHVLWNVLEQPQRIGNSLEASLQAKLPLAGLSVKRHLKLSANQSICRVQEEVTNDRPLGRVYNMVQHPTISPPFLDAETLVDCNGRRGFAQGNPLPHPEEPSFHWPLALTRDGTSVNLRHLTDSSDPNVVTYAIDERYGWVTAASPKRGLLIGYLWKTSDYPWVSLWRDVRDGKPAARGLEFGTTGLHQPFAQLTRVGLIWDRPVMEHLDAGESRSRSYTIYIIPIPDNFSGVDGVMVSGPKLILRERRTDSPRSLELQAGEELLP